MCHTRYKLSAGASLLKIFSLQDRTECQNFIRNFVVVEYSRINRSQTSIFNLWNVLEKHDRPNSAVRHDHVRTGQPASRTHESKHADFSNI